MKIVLLSLLVGPMALAQVKKIEVKHVEQKIVRQTKEIKTSEVKTSEDAVRKIKNVSSSLGNEGGGGGDVACEDRIKIIRDDIKSWMQKGGSQSLVLKDLDQESYVDGMLSAIKQAKIKCVGPNDPGYPVLVNGTPKTCRFDVNNSGATITCDFEKFQKTSESDQYVLVHHEFAGIAGVEIPNGDDSDYFVSNQISAFLENVVVKKLAVKPRSAFNTGNSIIDFIREEFRNGKLPSDQDLKIGGTVTNCVWYGGYGDRWTDPGDRWKASYHSDIQFSHYDGMIKKVFLNKDGTVDNDKKQQTYLVPSKTGLVFHEDEKQNYEIRATTGGDLIFELSSENTQLKTPAIANPSLNVVYYLMCVNQIK